MSWIVERLLIDRYRIKTTQPIDEDVWDRLIFLEKKIGTLYKEELVSDLEISVIKKMEENKSFSQIAYEMEMSRSTVTKIFRNACNRIAFYLGGYYTDDGFLDSLQENYGLSKEEVHKVYEKINSKYRHMI